MAMVPLLSPSLLKAIALVYWFGNQGVLNSLLFGHSIYGPLPGAQRSEYSSSVAGPGLVERLSRRRPVRDRHVIPDEPGSTDLRREFRYAETGELVIFDERQHGDGG